MPPTARAASCENRRAVKTAVAVAGRALTPWYCEVCDVEFGSAQVCSSHSVHSAASETGDLIMINRTRPVQCNQTA